MGDKKVLLIIPSAIVARGLESVMDNLGEFRSIGILSDISRTGGNRLRSFDADLIILDPQVLDCETRPSARAFISTLTDVPVVAMATIPLDDETLRQFDEVIGMFDDPTTIIRKLRSAMEARGEAPRAEGEELSAREKEILVCVAKGMLNKEIADLHNISIYTVITHRKNITRKTGIKTVAGLTVYALLNNLIDVNSFE